MRGADEVTCVCGHPGVEHDVDARWCLHEPNRCDCSRYEVTCYRPGPEILTGEESGWGGVRAMDVVNGRDVDRDPRRLMAV